MTSSITRLIRSLILAGWPDDEVHRLFVHTNVSFTHQELQTRIDRQRRKVKQKGAIAL